MKVLIPPPSTLLESADKPSLSSPDSKVLLRSYFRDFDVPPPKFPGKRKSKSPPAALPSVSSPLLQLFTWYSRRYLKKHFHTVRLSREGPAPVIQQLPLVIYSNHASWWDPLVAIFLRDKFFPHRAAYAPMDSNMLRRYGFFRRLGFFGVEPATRRGAAQFLSTSAAVLSSPLNILAITPQARFVDVRERPLRFSSGIGHLAASVQRACFVPLAIEYTFWEERLPEILVRFGSPLEPGRCGLGPKKPQEWTNLFEEQLQQTQEALSTEACRRSPDDFLTLLHGAVGQSPVYDLWRRLKSCWSGEPFKKEHGLK